MSLQWPRQLNAPLAEVDPQLYDIIEKEKNRQFKVGLMSVPSSLPAIVTHISL